MGIGWDVEFWADRTKLKWWLDDLTGQLGGWHHWIGHRYSDSDIGQGIDPDPANKDEYPPERLDELMAASDYITAAALLTPTTRHLIGAEAIAAMKPAAVIINIGRGPVIDETPLIDALREGRIRGAALDVFETEPLPKGHPFYKLDNILLSPHSADHTPGWEEASLRLFLENFGRFQKGEPLLNIVDKEAGY